jgi:DNA-binding transcriptional LysR family regulator
MMHKMHSRLPDIDFSHLRTFLALTKVANFSETGRQLGLSQSAVSRHIRGLEEMLGVRLFERLGRRAVLTSAGRALRTRLQTLMREAESLPRAIRDLAQGVRGDLRIGASVTAANAIVPPVLGAYRRQYPNVELALQPSNSARLLETLGSGEIDLAFVGCEAPPQGVTVLAEIPDEIVLITSRAHPFAGRRIRQEDMRGCDFIHRDVGSDTRAMVEQWFRAESVQPRTLMEVG